MTERKTKEENWTGLDDLDQKYESCPVFFS
jgi:hypothetical protein